jgi:hypothetical protein
VAEHALATTVAIQLGCVDHPVTDIKGVFYRRDFRIMSFCGLTHPVGAKCYPLWKTQWAIGGIQGFYLGRILNVIAPAPHQYAMNMPIGKPPRRSAVNQIHCRAISPYLD